jgi:hypothetical protein|tara:strand:- start:1040 stop:2512 length:1473 start_codon:yes stop_codon:yes gene_type:complete
MSFIYRNPSSGVILPQTNVVSPVEIIGTNFSVLGAGGYMEVWSLSNLNYQTFGASGVIYNSGNTIPIFYSKSPLGFVPSKLTIENDGITSGRRRLGMQVYVHETDTVYQYIIPNYETLFNAASGATETDPFEGSYTVFDNTTPGLALVNAWLDSSIEGVSGVTRTNARWRIFYGTDVTVTGGTYSNGTAIFTNTTGGTFNVTGFSTGSSSSYTSWFAEGDNQAPAVPIDVVDGFTLKFAGVITSGGAGIATDSAISANEMTIGLMNNGGTPDSTTFYRGDGQWIVPTDIVVSGGTYDNASGILTLNRSDGGSLPISGFTTGTTEDTYVTGMSYSQVSKELTLGLNDGVDFIATGFAAEVTGGTYNSGGTITLNNNDGTTSTITGLGAINTNIYTDDGTLEGDRIVEQDTHHITFSGGTGVSIGTGTTSPVCALLELASENQGLLIPRMTQTQRENIPTPLPGLLLYCTNTTVDAEEGLYMYKSLGWVSIL